MNRRINRPVPRIYSNYQRIIILGGMGVVISPTSLGMMIDQETQLERIDGEILCYIFNISLI